MINFSLISLPFSYLPVSLYFYLTCLQKKKNNKFSFMKNWNLYDTLMLPGDRKATVLMARFFEFLFTGIKHHG